MLKKKVPTLLAEDAWLWKMLQRVDSDYLTFIGGFTSSIVISEFYELLLMDFRTEGWYQLPFMLVNALLLGVATLLLLSFTHRFADLQRHMDTHFDDVIEGYLEQEWDDPKAEVRKMRRCMTGVVWLCAAALAVGVARFVLNNFIM